jgi:hypothetical protein
MTNGFVRAALFGAVAIVASASSAFAWDQHVTFHNQSESDVLYFYATNTGVDDWGSDRLGANTILHVGNKIRRNITDNSGACSFDFRFELRSGRVIEARNQDVCEISDFWIE